MNTGCIGRPEDCPLRLASVRGRLCHSPVNLHSLQPHWHVQITTTSKLHSRSSIKEMSNWRPVEGKATCSRKGKEQVTQISLGGWGSAPSYAGALIRIHVTKLPSENI